MDENKHSHNIEAEQAVLGSMLIDSRCISDVLDKLSADDFFHPINKAIFSIIVELRNSGKAVDFVTASAYCHVDDMPKDEVSSYICALAEKTPTTAHVMEYVSILKGEQLQEAWEEPIPFTTIETPEFPVECLPAPVAAFVEALAESTQTPTEMSAVLSLGILSTAIQHRLQVEITPDWREPLCLYPVAVAPPGERKSAVISALAMPVYEYEAEMRESEEVEILQNQTERALLEKSLADAQSRAAKCKKVDERHAARNEALELTEKLANFKDKHPYRLMVDDTTPEKLVDIMDMQGGCITVSSAEGGVFDAIGGRYEKVLNLDVYLKGHAGDPITVDRIGRKSNHIPKPRLTMMLTVQPNVLTGLMDNMTLRGRGLCGRFLYAMCNSKVGRRNVDPSPIPDAVRDDYRQFVRYILSDTDTGVIRLSSEANKSRIQYAEEIEKRLGSMWEHMRDWGGKTVGAMLRIAALIHAAEAQGAPSETPISEDTIYAAIRINECLARHAMAAYQHMGANEASEDAKYLLKRITATGKSEIAKRELIRLCHGKFPKAEDMEAPLMMLIDMNYIKRTRKPTGGKPSENILVNPMCLK